jgi:hypothetical protein
MEFVVERIVDDAGVIQDLIGAGVEQNKTAYPFTLGSPQREVSVLSNPISKVF